MGGQMMGVYEISLPIRRGFRPRQGGLIGSFLLGFVLRYSFFSLCYAGAGSVADPGGQQAAGVERYCSACGGVVALVGGWFVWQGF